MPLTLLHGDNHLEIGDAIQLVRQRFNPADVLTFDGVTASLAAMSEACLTAGLFEPERLVLVHRLHDRFKGARKDGNEWEDVRVLLGNIAPSTTLLLLSPDMAAGHLLIDAVRSVGGKVRDFTTPRRQDLPRWILARAKQHQTTMSVDAAELLAELIGANAVMLDSEIEKLATYAGEESITPAMVDTLVGAITQESIFALIDAIAAGDRRVAFRLLHTQIEQATSTPIEVALYLIRMLARQVRILLRIRLGQEAGRSTSQIGTDLKLSRYYAGRYFQQAKRMTREQLITAFEHLAALEFALKNGEADPAAGLDLLVGALCA